MGKRLIPINKVEYDKRFKNTCLCISQWTVNPKEITHIPDEEIPKINSTYNKWYKAYEDTLKPHGPVETAAMLEAYKITSKIYSRFVKVWIRGFPEAFTPEKLAAMGIPPIDTTQTPIGKPQTRPEFRLIIRAARLIAVLFKDEGAESRARPKGCNGALVWWDILDTPPANPRELRHRNLATRSPFLMEFEEEQRGKHLYVALCWQAGGELGSFTEIQSEMIP